MQVENEMKNYSMKDMAFQSIRIPDFPDKPRRNGITMFLEYGMGLHEQWDLIESSGFFVDIVKIAAGMSRILAKDLLKEKIHLYRQANIHACPGGQFFELAHVQKRAEQFFEDALQIGYEHVEISDNCIDLSPEEKNKYIRMAKQMGLTVLGETGKKTEKSDIDYLIRDIEGALAAGAEKVFFEAKEFVSHDGEINHDLIEKLGKKINQDDLIFETPGTWIHGVHFFTQYELWKMLITIFGPKVNIANIPNLDALNRFSLMRLGLGADTDIESGAFWLSERGLL
jgi:phosphosulfolactate synthase